MTNQLLIIAEVISVITALGVALLVLFSARQSTLNRLICLALLLLAGWAGSIVLTAIFQSTFFGRLTFSFGIFTLPICIVFLLLFSGKPLDKWRLVLLLGPPTVVALLAPIEGLLFDQMEIINGSIVTYGAGALLPMFEVLYFFYTAYLIKVIYDGYKTLTGIKRVQLNYLIVGFVLTLGIATLTNMILPMLKIYDYTGYGPLTILPWTIAAAYMATKHHLWEPRVVLSEVWALLLILSALSAFLANRGSFELMILVMASIGSALLVNSVLAESKANADLRLKNIQLEKDKEELQKLDQMKNEFLDMATHELNTPIAAIKGRLDMAVKENTINLNDKQKEFLAPVLSNAGRLSDMAKDTLDVIQIDQKKFELHPTETDIDVFINDIISGFKNEVAQKNNTLIYTGLGSHAPKIALDQNKIKEMLINLISNANKFSQNGKIQIMAQIADDKITISVSDEGAGITAKDQEHLFEKFYHQAGLTRKIRENSKAPVWVYIFVKTLLNSTAAKSGSNRKRTTAALSLLLCPLFIDKLLCGNLLITNNLAMFYHSHFGSGSVG